MKKITAIFLALVLTLGLMTGCSHSSGAQNTQDNTEQQNQQQNTTVSVQNVDESKNVIISYIHSNAAIQASVSTEEAMINAIETRNLNFTLDIQDATGDTANLSSMIEDAVAKKVDAIIIDYADLRSTTSSLQVAANAGIPVITIDAGGYVPNTVCDITMNNYENAGKLGVYTINRLGTTGNVIIFDLDISAGVRQRCAVFEAILSENSGIKVLEDYNVDVDKIQQDTMDAMETFLQKYGIDGIDAVYCGWDEAAYAVSLVLKQHGYTNEDCFVVGMDGHWGCTLGYMQQDKEWAQVATVVQAFDKYGELTIDIIYKICLMGMTPEQAMNGRTNAYVRAPLVTIDTVDELEPNVLAGYANDFYYGDYTNPTDYVFSYELGE